MPFCQFSTGCTLLLMLTLIAFFAACLLSTLARRALLRAPALHECALSCHCCMLRCLPCADETEHARAFGVTAAHHRVEMGDGARDGDSDDEGLSRGRSVRLCWLSL